MFFSFGGEISTRERAETKEKIRAKNRRRRPQKLKVDGVEVHPAVEAIETENGDGVGSGC